MIILQTKTTIQASQERCFDLARSVDLHAAGAAGIAGRAMAGRTTGLSDLGDRTTWTARFFGLGFALTTEVTGFDRPHGFSDAQCSGPFAHFGHVYGFREAGKGRTVMTDVFSFQSPFGLIGALFDSVVLRGRMQVVMEARAITIRRAAESPPPPILGESEQT